MMTLRELCGHVNVSRRSIQCYEKAGLMQPTAKNKYGHLLYDESMLRRARWIRFLQQLGFKLKEIEGIIDAPETEIREALMVQIGHLKHEKERLEEIIQEANEYIEKGRSEYI
nr:MerR family transcriptional regulator [Eubacterium sp.]